MADVTAWTSVDDLERLARDKLGDVVYDSIAGGAGDEIAVRANAEAFARAYLRPRILVDVSEISTETSILGTHLGAPIFVAPMGGQQRAHPEGEAATAAGAADAGVGYVLSSMSSVSLDAVAARAGEARWYQIYFVSRDRGLVRDWIARAEAAGYRAICVTGDSPIVTPRQRDLRHEVEGRKPYSSIVASQYVPTYAVIDDAAVARFPLAVSDPALTWRDIEWLRSATSLPVLVKGVMTAEDARLAVDSGAQGIMVSNHGGRILDHTFGTLEALPEIVEAVRGRVPIIVDGGVRRPTDIAIALSLGAAAVAIGRPVMWALACGGAGGVSRLLQSLVLGLLRTMALVGVTTIDGFTPAHAGLRPSTRSPLSQSVF